MDKKLSQKDQRIKDLESKREKDRKKIQRRETRDLQGGSRRTIPGEFFVDTISNLAQRAATADEERCTMTAEDSLHDAHFVMPPCEVRSEQPEKIVNKKSNFLAHAAYSDSQLSDAIGICLTYLIGDKERAILCHEVSIVSLCARSRS